MNKQSFFKILEREIKGLPKEEQANALEFYKEYFNECESEAMAIDRLPHPSEIAKNLYQELGLEQKPARHYSPLAIAGIVILVLLFGPAVIGLLIGAFSLIVIVPASIVVATATTCVASLLVLIPAVLVNPANGVSFMGLALLSLGACMLCLKITKYTLGQFKELSKKAVALVRGY